MCFCCARPHLFLFGSWMRNRKFTCCGLTPQRSCISFWALSFPGFSIHHNMDLFFYIRNFKTSSGFRQSFKNLELSLLNSEKNSPPPMPLNEVFIETPSDLHLHAVFDLESVQTPQWLELLQIQEDSIKPSTRVCSRHFPSGGDPSKLNPIPISDH